MKRVKQGNGEGMKFYLDIGKAIIHEGGKTGTLFLNAQNGDFVLFPQDPQGQGRDRRGGRLCRVAAATGRPPGRPGGRACQARSAP